jgi:hypothetical protein
MSATKTTLAGMITFIAAGISPAIGAPLQGAVKEPAPAVGLRRGPAVERRLFSDTFEASTFLWNDWNKFQENYHANYAGDDDPSTAWVEGDKGSGVGQWLRMAVTPLDGTSAVRVRIRNGYQKSPELFKQNARVRIATITLLPSNTKITVDIKDDQAWQEFVIPQTEGSFKAVELKVNTVYEGSKYTDMCISDMQVFATSITADNPAFEKAKRKKLLDWRKARVAAAKEFAKGGVGSVLLSSYSKKVESEVEQWGDNESIPNIFLKPALKQWKSELPILKAVLAQYGARGEGDFVLLPAQLFSQSGGKVVPPDGFARLSLSQAYYQDEGNEAVLPAVNAGAMFSSDRIKVAEIKSKATVGDVLSEEKCKGSKAFVMRSKDIEGQAADRVVALVITECGMVETRGGKDLAATAQVLIYRPDGKLAMVAGADFDGINLRYITGYTWAERDGKSVVASAQMFTRWQLATFTAK